MTDQEKDLRMRMSMLLDSDLDGQDNPRLIDAIESNPELKSAWASYCLIGDVLRSSATEQSASVDFVDKVSELIAAEPTILAPRAIKPMVDKRSSVVTLGLAASLALVAIMVGKSINDHAEVFQTASYKHSGNSQAAPKSTGPAENLAESQFNDYLVMHNETAYMAGSAAMLPYVRVVGAGSGR